MASAHAWAGTWTRRVARYVAPSEFARGVYLQGGWNGSKIEVIPNFVFPDPLEASGNGGFALFVGRLAEVKGLDTLLEAWDGGGINFPLQIVGDGPLRSQVQKVAAANPNVEYRGVKDHSDVVRLMGDATFIVVPTRGIESFGRVVVEAMARGTPAVVADHGGLAEIVSGSDAGFLFPPGDHRALADRVRELIADTDRLAAMRRAARRVYVERYSGEVALGRWIDLYTSVIRD